MHRGVGSCQRKPRLQRASFPRWSLLLWPSFGAGTGSGGAVLAEFRRHGQTAVLAGHDEPHDACRLASGPAVLGDGGEAEKAGRRCRRRRGRRCRGGRRTSFFCVLSFWVPAAPERGLLDGLAARRRTKRGAGNLWRFAGACRESGDSVIGYLFTTLTELRIFSMPPVSVPARVMAENLPVASLTLTTTVTFTPSDSPLSTQASPF